MGIFQMGLGGETGKNMPQGSSPQQEPIHSDLRPSQLSQPTTLNSRSDHPIAAVSPLPFPVPPALEVGAAKRSPWFCHFPIWQELRILHYRK